MPQNKIKIINISQFQSCLFLFIMGLLSSFNTSLIKLSRLQMEMMNAKYIFLVKNKNNLGSYPLTVLIISK